MTRTPKVPSYRLHKPTNQAIVVIRGKMFYLGRYGSIDSHAEYNRLIAEWLAQGAATVPERKGSVPGPTCGSSS